MLNEILSLLVDLVHAQVRAVERRWQRFCIALILILAAGLVAVLAVAILAFALFAFLTVNAKLGLPLAAVLTAVALGGVILPVLLIARSLLR